MSLFDDLTDDDAGVERGDLHSVSGLVRLLTLPGIGPKKAVRLANYFAQWERLAKAPLAELATVVRGNAQELFDVIQYCSPAPELPEEIKAIGCFDDEWPEWLRSINDPPAVVYVRGTLPPGGSLGVVGTRHPTEYGAKVVDSVVREAARRKIGIVSGLALGIDGASHGAAIRYDTPTWAILGSGVDLPTPREHHRLALEIIEAGGGLLSEQPLGTQPSARTLVARNRLQSASSSSLVVAQCGIPSGTLHTVRFAVSQGRRLVVPRPRPPWSQEPQSAGNMALTDPAGCDPQVIGATGPLAKLVASKKPLADVVLSDSSEIDRIWNP